MGKNHLLLERTKKDKNKPEYKVNLIIHKG